MASAGARAYNGGLGAEPPVGPRGKAPGQEVRGRSSTEADDDFITQLGLHNAWADSGMLPGYADWEAAKILGGGNIYSY